MDMARHTHRISYKYIKGQCYVHNPFASRQLWYLSQNQQTYLLLPVSLELILLHASAHYCLW